MALLQRAGLCARAGLPILLVAGCGVSRPATRPACPVAPTQAPSAAAQPQVPSADQTSQVAARPQVRPVSLQVPEVEPTVDVCPDGLFAGQAELSLEQLTALVLARNASLQAMTFAWQSATQRYPQAIAL